MPTPILELAPTWSATKRVTVPVSRTKLGDGYEQIVAEGTTGAIEEWDVQSPSLLTAVAQDKLSQLETFSGVTAFYWSPDNSVYIPRKTYTCEGWKVIRLGNNYQQITATFKQQLPSPSFQVICNGIYTDKGRILEFLPESYGSFFTFWLTTKAGHTGTGAIEVNKWNNNLSTFNNRVWMMDIDKGNYFTFAPTAQTKYFSFNQTNPVQGYKAIMYFTADYNTLKFDGFS
ncbi:MAG: phage tail protein [Nostoc sp. NMS2]|uniref:phage tail protein n=1 Tax=Nostoc sp. NMS2 TaxID=2815389 RepID=UPI0025F5539E|nr:phage tail protein [Nostoc sp. NMS2]MBN3993821.1 phage tail protein [Nostoc sp. NMS2]